jgi:diguanylate cyclase (GGDEF)-like protein/PAS domain S-box-containing protein
LLISHDTMKSLKLTLVLSHTGIMLLATLILGLFLFPLMTRQLEKREITELQFLVEHGVSLTERYIQKQSRLLEHVADNHVVLNYLNNYRDLALTEYLASFHVDLPRISFVGADGFEEIRVQKGKLVESEENYQLSPFFQQSLDHPNEVMVVLDPNQHTRKRPAIILALTKTLYFGDQFAGLLLAHIPLQQIAKDLLQLKIGENGFLVLQDQTGEAYLISRQNQEVRRLSKDSFSIPQYDHDEIPHKLSFYSTNDILRENAFWTHVHLKQYQLNLWAVIPRDELVAEAKKLQQTTLLLFALISILSFLGAFLLAHNITSPLAKLTKAVRALSKTKDQEFIRLKSHNEIGVLADAFNDMIKDLNQTTISRDYFNTIISSMRESLIVVDTRGRIQTVNNATTSLLGHETDELMGRPLSDLLQKDEEKRQKFMVKLCSGQEIKNKDVIYIGQDNRKIPVLFSAAPMQNQDLTIQGIVCVAIDMTIHNQVLDDLRQSRIQLQRLAITDELTGLLNRRGFMTLAGKQLQTANRMKTNIFLLYLDVDGLKNVNDTLGHHEGDHLICDVAELLRNTFREADIISRLGGDEFAALLFDTQDADGITRRLNDTITTFNQEHKRPYLITISYGLIAYDADAPCSLEKLLTRADSLMYKQKMEKKKPPSS